MDNVTIEKDIKAIRHMLAWITVIVVIGALSLVGAVAGYYVQQSREQVHTDVTYCIAHPDSC